MERERAKSVATLRLSEHFAKLSAPKRAREYASLELDARVKSGDKSNADTIAADGLDEAAINLEAGAVSGRTHAHSWPTARSDGQGGGEPARESRPSLADVIEADLVLGGSQADGDLLRVIATRLSQSHSSSSSLSMKMRRNTTAGAHSRAPSASVFGRLSQSIGGGGKSHKQLDEPSVSKDKAPEPLSCRYCLEEVEPSDDCSTCVCTGPLCESCLQGELQLTFSRGKRVMHCTVCLHVFNITDFKEVPLPKPRFPRCYDARGVLMSMPVFLPVFFWTIFTSIYSFIDRDFSVIRGDVFFIAELAIMAFSLHFCWKSREPTRSWMRALYTMRAIRSGFVVVVWHYTWIDTIFLIFSLIFVMGSCLRRPDGQDAHEGEFSLDVWVNDVGPMRLEQSDEWTEAPTFDMIRRNQESAAAEREVQVAQRRLGEVIQQEHDDDMRHLSHLAQSEIDAREAALGRFLGFGRGQEESVSRADSLEAQREVPVAST